VTALYHICISKFILGIMHLTTRTVEETVETKSHNIWPWCTTKRKFSNVQGIPQVMNPAKISHVSDISSYTWSRVIPYIWLIKSGMAGIYICIYFCITAYELLKHKVNTYLWHFQEYHISYKDFEWLYNMAVCKRLFENIIHKHTISY
jgi:hypothetical protein